MIVFDYSTQVDIIICWVWNGTSIVVSYNDVSYLTYYLWWHRHWIHYNYWYCWVVSSAHTGWQNYRLRMKWITVLLHFKIVFRTEHIIHAWHVAYGPILVCTRARRLDFVVTLLPLEIPQQTESRLRVRPATGSKKAPGGVLLEHYTCCLRSHHAWGVVVWILWSMFCHFTFTGNSQ
jgi:hypothetical protein